MKKYLIYLGLAVAVGLSSCSKDRGLGNDGQPEEIPDGYGAVQLALKTPPAPKATTIPGTTAENAVDNVYIYVFKNGELEAMEQNIAAADFETGDPTLDGYSYKTLKLKGAGGRNIYVLANADQQKIEDADFDIGQPEADFLALKTTELVDGKAMKTPLLMTAVNIGFNVAEGIKSTCKLDLKRAVARFDIKIAETGAKAEPFFEIVSARVINARTQISLLPQDAHDEAPATNPALANLESVVNTDQPVADRGGKIVTMKGQLYAYENLFMVDVDGKQAPTQWELDNATTIEVTGNRLKWKDGQVEQTTSATYVVNFVSVVYTDDKVTARTPVQIDRNNLYTITLIPGKESDLDNTVTIEDWENGDVVIDKEADGGLADIKASDITPEYTNAANITYDNANKENLTFTVAGKKGAVIDIYIQSSVQPTLSYGALSGLQITDFVQVTPGGIKPPVSKNAVTKATDDKYPTIDGKDKMLFMARVNVRSNTQTVADGYKFHVLTKDGEIGKEYTLIKTDKLDVVDPANCFMVKPGESISFEATVMGNGNTTAEPLATETVEILWQDAQGMMTTANVVYDKTEGFATVTPQVAGNAVVVAKNAGGETVWSWHIWVSDYQPVKQSSVAANTAYTVTGGEVHTYGTQYMRVNRGKVIMDRNLGATKTYYEPIPAGTPADEVSKCFGMYYQWGRKDPFPRWDGVGSSDASAATVTLYGADGATPLTEGAKDNTTATGLKRVSVTIAGSIPPATLEYATKNPLSFIYSSAVPYDWYTTAADNSAGNGFWGDGTQKPVYDPCPAGWRIAANGTWNDFGTTPYAAPFFYYINGVQQTAAGTPTFVQSGRNGRLYAPTTGTVRTWYTTPGFRDAGNNFKFGVLQQVGHSGSSWAATASMGNQSNRAVFNSVLLEPERSSFRAGGYTVRCVQE